MPEETADRIGARALDLQLWVPAEGELRGIAADLAAKVAEHLGAAGKDAQSLGQKVAGLASDLGSANGTRGEAIAFDFRQTDRELVVEGRCAGEASQVRQQLPL